MLTVATWNVLHRVHAENYTEPVTVRWPDETDRVDAIAAVLARRPEQVVALQEVSGDQLAALHGLHFTVHAYRYSRVPAVRRTDPHLQDRGEHLVILTAGPSRAVAGESFAGDPGKGLLAVAAFDALIVCTHVGFGPAAGRQLARLAAASSDRTVLLGDFNADAATVSAGLGPDFTVAGTAPGSLPTRPGARVPDIDHVAVRGGAAHPARVEDANGLSDHNLLSAAVHW
ncbi:endonuclease/exonuclease/phosphatase family protein [Dactylosporangium vinaceum]|uniref:Endonuclease/exonuclease/phosphatase family protein n=1 Tax=Dactylosporangium vinaceum TaxID=53362 RepID=A0ABV5MAA2_9ACTN|nr:endonuclease/exonuclease/phosphatase family protein [Dactylosporangium vinaceum]UAB93055.1 endonuclease/exonuclease/phosphatase family protein [Dactylosporangium vinaceum]